MKISYEKPPNFAVLEKKFGVKWEDIVVTYGDTVHCPAPLAEHVLKHEAIHVRQQGEMGVEEWWKRYLDEPEFRYGQELEAYREQFRFIRSVVKDRNKQSGWLQELATALAGPMYGEIASRSEAAKQIIQ